MLWHARQAAAATARALPVGRQYIRHGLTRAARLSALRTATRLVSYLPDNNFSMSPFQETSDPLDRKTWEINTLLKKAFNSPTGFNTPIDISVLIQQLCDHGDFLEVQAERARNTITALPRLIDAVRTARSSQELAGRRRGD